jgi:Restriction endonuclease XhoI
MALNPDLEKRLRQAIKHFWTTRETQSQSQGSKTGSRDAGARTAVTGGRQMDGFVSLVRDYQTFQQSSFSIPLMNLAVFN